MKIVVLTSRFPYPLDKGDKLRAYHQIKALAVEHEVHLIALTAKNKNLDAGDLAEHLASIQVFKLSKLQRLFGMLWAFFTGRPIHVGYFFNGKIQRKIERQLNDLQSDALFCQLIRMAPYCMHPREHKLLDYMDAFSVGLERRSEASKGIMRWIWAWESRRLKRYEWEVFPHFQKHCIITEAEKNIIGLPASTSPLSVIPNGVNVNRFQSMDIEKSTDILFVGNMSYPPNVEAALFLVKRILPLLPKNTKVCLAGTQPQAKILELASEQVEVTGFVPDIVKKYNEAKVFVAPMQTGIGLQNKLLEALAIGLPVVCSPLAAKPLQAPEGVLYTAVKPAEYAHFILQELEEKNTDPQAIAARQNFVKQNFDWEQISKKIESLLVPDFVPLHSK